MIVKITLGVGLVISVETLPKIVKISSILPKLDDKKQMPLFI